MEKFNNTSIVTGYIKQLLHSFNLPCYRIYTKKNEEYFEKNFKEDDTIIETVIAEKNKDNEYDPHIRYVPYIKDGEIQEYINGEWVCKGMLNTEIGKHSHTYDLNRNILNYTKNLEIRDNIYDSYTHEYLGNYLRFLRDYRNVDLMPLYNCFSDVAVNNVNLKIATNFITDIDTKETKVKEVKFNSDDMYKLYVVPVKLFKEYTIAIDSSSPVEMCCILYDRVLDSREKFQGLPALTYEKRRSCNFNNPFVYSKLLSKEIISLTKSDSGAELAQSENELKLLIKIPKNNDSTIVILEGNYLNWNDSVYYPTGTGEEKHWVRKTNQAIINQEVNKNYVTDSVPFALKTPLQLLMFNTKEQHPYSDKLIQYLVDNTISELDEISNNVKRAQKVIEENGFRFKYEGLWVDGIREITYDFINRNNNNFITNRDILGYIDKDIEKHYKNKNNSIMSIELEEDR